MKAAVLKGIHQIPYIDVETPKPAQGEVLLKVEAVSICGSDIKRVLEGHRKTPLILGHESSGTVVELGDGVDPALLGMRASVIPLVPCFTCHPCQLGLYAACENYSFIGSRRDGCFAEYVTLPVRNLFPIGERVGFEEAALFEPLTVVIHGLKRAGFAPGGSVVVIGAGSLGMLAVQWLRWKGARLIVVTDVDNEKLALARHMGAHVTLNPQEKDLASEMKAITRDGADLVIEVAGVPQALEDAVSVARPRAQIVLTGNQPKGSAVPGEWIEKILRKELSLHGTWMSYSSPFPGSEWQEVLDAQASGALRLAEGVSHRYNLSEVPQVFQAIAAQELSFRKIMLFPEQNRGNAE